MPKSTPGGKAVTAAAKLYNKKLRAHRKAKKARRADEAEKVALASHLGNRAARRARAMADHPTAQVDAAVDA